MKVKKKLSWYYHISNNIIISTFELSLWKLNQISGVINGTAPNPVRLAEMCDHLGRVMGRPSWLPVPDFALKAVLGEGAAVVMIIRIHFYSICYLFKSIFF